jgi:deoxyribonuclease IV
MGQPTGAGRNPIPMKYKELTIPEPIISGAANVVVDPTQPVPVVPPPYDDADEYRPQPPPKPKVPVWMDGSFRIGIHTSIAGDIVESIESARKLGANCLQIFSASPRMWVHNTRIPDAEAQRFRARREAVALGPVVVHSNYLINMCSPEPVLRVRSVQAFHEELVRAVALGADFLVLHPGWGKTSARSQAIAEIAQGLRQAARGLKFNGLRVLLENAAGMGTSVGSRFEELRAIINACSDLPLGVCVDTAHLFAAGYEIRTHEGLERTLAVIDQTVGLNRVFVVHVNDSKTVFGSRVDRHAQLGKGHIGMAAFERLLHHRSLSGRAFILETPVDRAGDDSRNLRALWKLTGLDVRQTPKAEEGFTMFRPSGVRPRRKPAKKRAKPRPKARRKVRAKPRRKARGKTRTKPRARVRTKPRGQARTGPRKGARTKPRAKARAKPRKRASTKPRAKARAKPRAKARTKARSKPRKRAGAKPRKRARTKPRGRARRRAR